MPRVLDSTGMTAEATASIMHGLAQDAYTVDLSGGIPLDGTMPASTS